MVTDPSGLPLMDSMGPSIPATEDTWDRTGPHKRSAAEPAIQTFKSFVMVISIGCQPHPRALGRTSFVQINVRDCRRRCSGVGISRLHPPRCTPNAKKGQAHPGPLNLIHIYLEISNLQLTTTPTSPPIQSHGTEWIPAHHPSNPANLSGSPHSHRNLSYRHPLLPSKDAGSNSGFSAPGRR
jgi:hypothetical protein